MKKLRFSLESMKNSECISQQTPVNDQHFILFNSHWNQDQIWIRLFQTFPWLGCVHFCEPTVLWFKLLAKYPTLNHFCWRIKRDW